MSEDTVYAVASGKGGVGKTTLAINVGMAIAAADYRVVVVDVDLGMANLTDVIDFTPSRSTLHDVLAGADALEEATYEVTDGFFAIPSGAALESYASVDPDALEVVVDALRDAFDYVLLDLGAGISRESVLPLGLADDVLLVATPDLAAVKNVSKTAELVRKAEGNIEGVIVNRTREDDYIDEDRIAENLGPHLLGTIPEDVAVRKALNAGVPVVAHAPESPSARAYREIAAELAAGKQLRTHMKDTVEHDE